MNQPLTPMEDLLAVDPHSLRISVGLPHPLAKFGVAGKFEDGLYVDIILYFIRAAAMEEPDSRRGKAAMWFLLESEQTYFFVCDEAGIDAVKLRDHLRKWFGLPVDVWNCC